MNSNIYTVLIVDDEEDVRTTLLQKLESSVHPWEIVGESESVSDTIVKVKKTQPRSIFLDIKLREGDAFMVLSVLRESMDTLPLIILNTGYTEFDIAQKIINEYSDFEIILLKKPFWEYWDEKEKEIIEKIESTSNIKEDDVKYDNEKLVVRVGNITHFLDPQNIIFVEVESTNSAKIKICTINDVIIINKSLSKTKSLLPKQFVQINRQALVNQSYIKSFDHEDHILRLDTIVDRTFAVGMVFRKNLF